MPLEGRGKVKAVGEAGTRYISVPAKIARDSAFPFKDDEEVQITINPDKKNLTVTKIK
jgi:hypothetical protein